MHKHTMHEKHHGYFVAIAAAAFALCLLPLLSSSSTAYQEPELKIVDKLVFTSSSTKASFTISLAPSNAGGVMLYRDGLGDSSRCFSFTDPSTGKRYSSVDDLAEIKPNGRSITINVEFNPLCQACDASHLGRNYKYYIDYGIPAETRSERVIFAVPCKADVLMLTNRKRFTEDSAKDSLAFDSAIKEYMRAIAQDGLSAKYVELDSETAAKNFDYEIIHDPVATLNLPANIVNEQTFTLYAGDTARIPRKGKEDAVIKLRKINAKDGSVEIEVPQGLGKPANVTMKEGGYRLSPVGLALKKVNSTSATFAEFDVTEADINEGDGKLIYQHSIWVEKCGSIKDYGKKCNLGVCPGREECPFQSCAGLTMFQGKCSSEGEAELFACKKEKVNSTWVNAFQKTFQKIESGNATVIVREVSSEELNVTVNKTLCSVKIDKTVVCNNISISFKEINVSNDRVRVEVCQPSFARVRTGTPYDVLGEKTSIKLRPDIPGAEVNISNSSAVLSVNATSAVGDLTLGLLSIKPTPGTTVVKVYAWENPFMRVEGVAGPLFYRWPEYWAGFGTFSTQIRVIARSVEPTYLLILGGEDILPQPLRGTSEGITPDDWLYLPTRLQYAGGGEPKTIARMPTELGDLSSSLVVKALQTAVSSRNLAILKPALFGDACGGKNNCFIRKDLDKVSKSIYGVECKDNKFCFLAPPYCSSDRCKKEKSLLPTLSTFDAIYIDIHGSGTTLGATSENGVSYPFLSKDDIKNLSFKRPPVVFVGACYGGSIEAKLAGPEINLYGAGLATAFIERGARAYIGNSRVGLGGVAGTSADQLLKIYQLATAEGTGLTLGLAFGKVKEALELLGANYVRNEAVRHSLSALQFYGDPTQKIVLLGS